LKREYVLIFSNVPLQTEAVANKPSLWMFGSWVFNSW